MRVLSVGVAAAISVMAVGAGAQDWEQSLPKKPFSAEYVVTVSGQAMQGMPTMKVATSERALRVDFGAHVAIVQLRPGMAQVSTLMVNDKTYTVQSLPYDSEDLEAYLFMLTPPGGYEAACEEEAVSCEKVGVEDVAGRQAEHWKVEDPTEGMMDSWIDSELGILLMATGGDGSGIEARNISTAASPGSLFKVPGDYTLEGGEAW